MTKREARRIIVNSTPESLSRWQQALKEEEAGKAANIAYAKELLLEYKQAQSELARTAELLKSERESQGLTLAEVQDRTGISRAALCRLENLVDANPTIATLNRIAEALGKQLVVGLVDK